MYATEEESLYVANGKLLSKEDAEAFTCYIKKCTARVYLRSNGYAYKVANYSIQHGSMYNVQDI